LDNFINNLFNNGYESALNFISNLTGGVWDFYYNNYAGLESLSLVICGLLVFFIGFYIIRLDIIKSKMDKYSDALGVNITKKHAMRAWLQVVKRLETKSPLQIKTAVVDCEKIFDEVMKISGIKGKSMDERLEQLNSAEVKNLKDILEAHDIVKRFKDEPDFEVSYDQAKHILKIYKKTFQDFGMLD